MKGIFVGCPNHNCKKPLLTEAILPPRTSFKMLCSYCGSRSKLEAEAGKLRVILIHRPVESVELTDDDDDDIVMLNV